MHMVTSVTNQNHTYDDIMKQQHERLHKQSHDVLTKPENRRMKGLAMLKVKTAAATVKT